MNFIENNNLESFGVPQNQQEEEDKMSILDAKIAISVVRQEIAAMGGNDSEMDSLKQIEISLEEGTLSPRQAVADAERIKEQKQDYH